MNREAFLARLADRLAHAAPPATQHPPAPPPAEVPRVGFPPDERPLEARFAAALEAVHGRVTTPSGLPDVLAELDVHTAVATTGALALPDGIERLPLDRAPEAD